MAKIIQVSADTLDDKTLLLSGQESLELSMTFDDWTDITLVMGYSFTTNDNENFTGTFTTESSPVATVADMLLFGLKDDADDNVLANFVGYSATTGINGTVRNF